MKTIYLNLEDDVAKTVAKIKAYKGEEVVLVIPKDSYLLGDSINLRLLKKQVDMLSTKVSVLTMDVTGKMYAREAGFPLKRLPRVAPSKSFSDIRPQTETKIFKPHEIEEPEDSPEPEAEEEVVESNAPARKKVLRKVASAGGVKAKVAAPRVNSSKVYKTNRQVAAQNLPSDWLTENNEITKPLSNNVFMPPDTDAKQLPRKRSYWKWAMGFVAVSLIVVLVLTLVVLPSATVTIYAKGQNVARDLELTINSNASAVDVSRLTLPASAISENKEASQSFNVNGKKEVGAKAQGRVAIYNLTGSPLNLREQTTALTVGSKTYYFVGDQNGIVALEDANSDNNATVADIIAADGGEDFNLPAGTRVEINNQAFGSQPQRLYAKTVTQVIGGSSRFVSVISTEDIAEAQKTLIRNAVDEINRSLPNNRKLVDGAYAVDLQNFTTDKPEGTETTTFNASANISIRGLAFNESELREMVRSRLEQTLGDDKTLQSKELDVVVNKIGRLDYDAGLMQLSLHYESVALPNLDATAITNQLTAKSRAEAEDILLNNPDIERIDMKVAPSWQSSFPRVSSKIRVEVVK
ncbi:MAG TPA: hypothetical protein PKD34_00490 [Candidatus Doudnabacteria bacterium]|nr:hypothetical protein [Candidatus Doudnabacteria bacterium]